MNEQAPTTSEPTSKPDMGEMAYRLGEKMRANPKLETTIRRAGSTMITGAERADEAISIHVNMGRKRVVAGMHTRDSRWDDTTAGTHTEYLRR